MFGIRLTTDKEIQKLLSSVRNVTREERRKYYESVLKYMMINGTLPPECDLKLPKATMLIMGEEGSEVIAKDGKWLRLPLDGEPVKITYLHLEND